ncbi:MAG: phosphate acyltransferase, partial [Chloroflexota bacterium]|nr:phosphate acyltransferase [Chloroflexota bacterium]
MADKNNPRLLRVALDAMGGDYAPAETVKGAVEAARRGIAEVLLVGDPSAVNAELDKHVVTGLPLRVVPSEGCITENEHPALALRKKPRASVAVAARLVRAGQADAAVSMGSTGASMAAAAVLMGLLPSIERPGLGGNFL